MNDGQNTAHSTLEPISHQVLHGIQQEDRPIPHDEKQVFSDEGKQVAPHSGKQVWQDNDKQALVGDVGTGALVTEQENAQNVGHHRAPLNRHPRKKWIILGGILALITILAVILGPVLGLKHKSSAETATTSSSTSSATSPPAALPQRNIAAVSFATKSANNTHVYFQDDLGQILEAASSGTNRTWILSETGSAAKNGSAIAAAVSRPESSYVISIFFLDDNNTIHDSIYTPSTGRWKSGALSSQGYTTMPNSSLAAMYHECSLCANTTIITFQAENGAVQIGNLTSNGWTRTQLGAALDPAMGTGLALQPFKLVGREDQINLYHQKSGLNLSLASWHQLPAPTAAPGWSLTEQVYRPIPYGSKIAAASSYTNVSSGLETWIEVLSISDKGVEVDTWSGAINDWLRHGANPVTMTNSSSNGKSYESVAVTATGSAFGAVRQDGRVDQIENWQVTDDLVDWVLVGNVDLGDAWG
ncbi:MAG: hypothetical protein Q9225_004652 [Loekoesia sp. 1 TL-2023]